MKILFVDDEKPILEMLQSAFQTDGWEIETAQDGREALEKLHLAHFDIVVLDLIMPHMRGMDVLQAIKDLRISTSVIVLTGYGSVDLATHALCLGASDFIKKPFDIGELKARIQKLLENAQIMWSPIAERLDEFLSLHAINPDLNLEALSVHFGLTPGYISDMLRKYFGMAFQRRLAWHRVHQAKILLETFEKSPIKLIALQCGFKNQQRLTETFSRLEGISPKKYQVMIRDRRKNQ